MRIWPPPGNRGPRHVDVRIPRRRALQLIPPRRFSPARDVRVREHSNRPHWQLRRRLFAIMMTPLYSAHAAPSNLYPRGVTYVPDSDIPRAPRGTALAVADDHMRMCVRNTDILYPDTDRGCGCFHSANSTWSLLCTGGSVGGRVYSGARHAPPAAWRIRRSDPSESQVAER